MDFRGSEVCTGEVMPELGSAVEGREVCTDMGEKSALKNIWVGGEVMCIKGDFEGESCVLGVIWGERSL